MKHKYLLTTIVFLISLSFGEHRGEVFAQQLSPRYIRMPSNNSSDLVPTNRAGQLVGITVKDSADAAGNIWKVPYLYRLDSTGKLIFNKHYKFAGPNAYQGFSEVIPSKDSLYILGDLHDESGDCHGNNMMIFKTDSAGNVNWKKKWGDYGSCEGFTNHFVCSDGGLALCATGDFQLNDTTGDWYFAHKASIIKFNSNGTVAFNKGFQTPYRLSPARAYLYFTAMAETPEKGFMIVGHNSPDPIKFHYGYDSTGTRSTSDAILYLLKIDADGNKLWDKQITYDYNKQYVKEFNVRDIIAHPAGGYIAVGKAAIAEWDPKGSRYEPATNKHYSDYSGGLIMKISEEGVVEWIKAIRHPLYQTAPMSSGPWANYGIRFTKIIPSASAPAGFIVSGLLTIDNVSRPLQDSGNGNLQCCLGITKSLIVKTDFNGNMLWDREYGSLSDLWSKTYFNVYEEPGGSIILNCLASPDSMDIANFNQYKNPLPVKGLLRLNSDGYLDDPLCSLSPKLLVYEDDTILSSFTNTSFQYDSTALGTIKAVGVFPDAVSTAVTYGVCTNSILANFSYDIACSSSGNGAMVKFTNTSLSASLFHYDFGDPTSLKNSSDSAYVQHFYSKGGTYTVSLTVWDSDSSKLNTITKKIIVPEIRHITMHTSNTSVCQGTAVNLTATISSGFFAPSTFTFAIIKVPTPDYTAISTDSTFSTIPLDTTLSFFIYPGTCVVSDTIVVTVIPTVHMSVKGDNLLCAGDTSLLIASGSKTYSWKPGNTINDSLIVFPGKTTTYTVSSGQSTVCGTDTASIKIIVNAKPLVNISSEQTIFPGGQAHLLASGGTSYLWSPATGLNSVSIANLTAAPTQTTIYTVKITDANGCLNSDSVIVNVKYCGVDLFVPNAFSPNADNENDVLYVKTLNNNCIQSITFKIFDRWGNKVFETNDINIGWNGSYRAKAMDADVFVYFLNAVIETGEVITQKGNISLIR